MKVNGVQNKTQLLLLFFSFPLTICVTQLRMDCLMKYNIVISFHMQSASC